jgi:quercetin dioxygenase-like cupin family protein
MKTIKKNLISLLCGIFMILSAHVHAQDPAKVAPNLYKVVLDNDKVRVMELNIAPNDIVPWHNHPYHFVYALADGKLEITDKGKAPQTAEIKAGEVMEMAATTHMAKNTGGTTIKLIVTELKPKN